MSSKTAGQLQQQQGRRTPLSLAGGKNNHHQQQHNNKSNQNSYNNMSKNQETKDTNSQSTKQNGNNNNNQKDSNATQQKDNKKSHQNGNKQHVTSSNSEQNQKSNGNNDVVVVVEKNGTSNGNNTNGVSNKNNASKSSIQTATKETKDKEKLKDKDKEAVVNEAPKEKTKKSDSLKVNAANEKSIPPPAELPQKSVEQTPSSTISSNKSKNEITPVPAIAIDKKQNSSIPSGVKSKASPIPSKSTEKANTAANTPTLKSPVVSTNKIAPILKSPKAPTKKEITTDILTENDVEVDMEPLNLDQSPVKVSKTALPNIVPTATSTPGKFNINAKSEIELIMDTASVDGVSGGSPDLSSVPRTFSQISGRRGIRNTGDFTPSAYNSQFRESYRRINTELDVTGNTNNTSLNVTVGSEIPNNSSFLSFSLFGRNRKRERTPPATDLDKSQSGAEPTVETTPPKRARLDMHGIFTVMSSPLTLLRSRFSKATIDGPQADANEHLGDQENKSDELENVQNVSGVSIEEVAEHTATGDITIGKEAIAAADNTPTKSADTVDKPDDVIVLLDDDDAKASAADMDVDSDIKITETLLIPAVGEPKGKQKGCILM